MSTTSLFVELVVIGIGAALWLLLLIGAAAGVDLRGLAGWVGLETALPVLAVVYVLGIVVDRVADAVFDRLWATRLRRKSFGEIGRYYDARRDILTRSERLSELLEYGRSRLRICRGWFLNAILLAVSLNLYLLLTPLPGVNALASSVIGTTLCVLLALGTWYAWKSLAEAEYRKVREQSEYLGAGSAAKAGVQDECSRSQT